MTAIYPKVQVYKKNNPITVRPGMAGKIAVVGAFDSTETNPLHFSSLDEAYQTLGTDTTYNGVACLGDLFYGADSIIAVNITTKSGQTVNKAITTENLTGALAKIKNETFDCLFVCETLTDAFIPIITTFLDERMLNKLPAGFSGSLSRTTLAEYTTTAGLLGEYSYGVIAGQQFKVNGTEISLLRTGAYWCGVVASLNVGASMTKKIVPNVTGLTPELTFEVVDTGFTGLNLLQLGFMTFECFDRENELFVCVNSEQPNGLDLYINRVRDYVIREMSLHKFLGERNVDLTIGQIEQELDRVKYNCVDTLDLLKDIEYNVSKKNANCVDVNITKLLFAGLITEIDVYFTIEVE